jgi:hypothetical protein
MNATTTYTKSQITELKEFAKENILSFEEANECCSVSESTESYVIEPTNRYSVYEIQLWTKLVSPNKIVEVMHIVQCSWGSFTIDITNKEKDRLLEDTSFINTRNTKIYVNDLHETGNSCIKVVDNDEDELTDEEIDDIERDPDIINTPGWILRSVYYEIFNGFSLSLSR